MMCSGAGVFVLREVELVEEVSRVGEEGYM